MSIFQKSCPECSAPNPVQAVSCRCGYCFDPDTLARTDPAEYAQQQDRLYRDYLAARIAQAEAELAVARELAKADPENAYKASGALLAEQALNALQAEMRQVTLRIGTAPPPPRPTPAPRKAEAPKPVAPKPSPTKPNGARPQPILAKTNGPGITAKARIARGPSAVSAETTAAPGPRPAPAAAARPTAVATGGKTAQAPKISVRPGESFRRLQAERAEAIARAKPPLVKPAVTPPKPATARAAVARRPAPKPADIPPIPIAAAKPAMQDCPNCTASVPADRQRCGCGYTFSRAAEEVPAITLDATALAILTEGISAIKRTPRSR